MNEIFPGKKIKSINPATMEVNAEVECLSAERVRAAVRESWQAFSTWRTRSFSDRAKYILRAADIILKKSDEIVGVICKETGKPRVEAVIAEILTALDLIQYYTKKTEKLLKKENINIGKWGLMMRKSYLEYYPLGVIGIISPWNFPFTIPMGQIVMALMCGNTVIMKPSEYTLLVGLKIEEIFNEAELPKGVYRTVPGDGATGDALVRAGVKKIIFTGSVATGKKIMAAASETLTPVILELGGKDPVIVFEDSDLENAARSAVWGAFFNSGQVCCSVERLYVAESIADKFINLVVEKTKKLRQGVDDNFNIEVGSMTNQRQLEIVESHVDDARKRGAKILTGGKRKGSLNGYFYEPTVLSGVDHTFRIVKEESFGPILPIMTFKTEAEAISLANDSEYGLTAGIWTKDLGKAQRIASSLDYGTITVNDHLVTHGISQTPWGGVKNSGFGKTHGKTGLLELVEARHVHINKSIFPNIWWYKYSPNKYNLLKNALGLLYGHGIIKRMVSLVRVLKNISFRDMI
ncbi:MAG TPA: aldehyde dehydrogenase family protein [bacterium]